MNQFPFTRGTTALLAIVLLSLALPATAELVLTDHGQSSYQIVLPANAIPSERYAAQELQRYVELISGAKLPITTDAEKSAPKAILLGDNAQLRSLGGKVDFAQLGAEGFVIRTEGNHLIIAGGKPRGTLNGVYTFLEEQLGIRWFTPEVEKCPKQNRVELPLLDQTNIPALEYREVFWTEMFRNADFAARHRLNGQHYGLTEKHGGRAVVYYPFVHSFDNLIPTNLWSEHPEYFPFRKGKRINGYVQRCLSNPDVLKLSIARVREWIQKHPEATIISVSQNDTGEWCECDKCKTLDGAEGSPCASLMQFVNTIAQDIEKEFPKVRIDTLAYQYTRKPPKTIRPRANVIVRLCSIECCFAHPLDTCTSEENRRFRDDIIAWQPVAPLLYIWDYTPNFSNYLQPFPNFDALQPNVRFFTQHGVKGLFEQGNYSSGGNGEMGPLRAYLLAKLLWNPNTDLEKHRREFLQAYFGQAASKVQDYLELTHRPVREKGLHAHIFDSPKSAYLTNELFIQGERLLDEAEQLAENDTIRQHVQVARLPVWYLKLANNRVTGEARTNLLNRFVEIALQAGITDIREGGPLKSWATKQGARLPAK